MTVDSQNSTYINAIKFSDFAVRIVAPAQKIEPYMDLPLTMDYERYPGTPKRVKDPFGSGGI